MPSRMTLDKQFLNTHFCLNLMVRYISERQIDLPLQVQMLKTYSDFFLPWQVNISTSLNKKLLCSVLSADLAGLFCDWQPRKQAFAVYRVYWVCPETCPPQHMHTQLLLSFFDILKETGKKNRTQHNQSTSNSHCPQVKIFWGWLLIEGSWEISKTFLGKQGVISKQGLSEPRKLSNRARLVVTNYLWESGKMPESVVAPIRERANTSQLCLFCQWGAKLACTVI